MAVASFGQASSKTKRVDEVHRDARAVKNRHDLNNVKRAW